MGEVKKILLTGATGYLGSNLLKILLNSGFEVCIVKRSTSSLKRITDIIDSVSVFDNDEQSIVNLFEQHRIDLVIHTATSYGRKGETLLEIKEANLDFPLLILSHVLKNNVKYFINTGTSLPELTNIYSLFKAQFAKCLEFYSSSVTTINILLEHFYGPGDDNSKFITSMINKMLENEAEIRLTEGNQLRDFIFIEDTLKAYLTLTENLNRFNGFNEVPLGSGEVISIRSVIELVKQQTNSSSELLFGVIPMRLNELMESNADITVMKQLGWQPRVSFANGLTKTIESEIACKN